MVFENFFLYNSRRIGEEFSVKISVNNPTVTPIFLSPTVCFS